jgi:hypothetical protein
MPGDRNQGEEWRFEKNANTQGEREILSEVYMKARQQTGIISIATFLYSI